MPLIAQVGKWVCYQNLFMLSELTVENPPKTSEGILKRIDEMNSRQLPEELL